MGKQTKVIRSVQRALDILNLFNTQDFELGTTEIGRALDLPKSTVAGLAGTLTLNGYLEQDPATHKYRLGFKLAERAGLLLGQFDLRKQAAQQLQALRDEFNETVNMGLLRGGEVVYIERMLGTNMLGMRSEIGKHERAHSTALGKAMLSFSSADNIQEFLAENELVAVTEYTITDAEVFRQELEVTRQRGYAIDNQENELGGRCVAAPILDFQGQPVAAISLSLPIQRFPDARVPLLGSRVSQTAQAISRQLGYQPAQA